MKILLAGDSTVASCPTQEYPMSGWGAHLAPVVYSWAAVHNFARGGATTVSFREEGLWRELLHQAVSGDVVAHSVRPQRPEARAPGRPGRLCGQPPPDGGGGPV
jgi:hypothetical protein